VRQLILNAVVEKLNPSIPNKIEVQREVLENLERSCEGVLTIAEIDQGKRELDIARAEREALKRDVKTTLETCGPVASYSECLYNLMTQFTIKGTDNTIPYSLSSFIRTLLIALDESRYSSMPKVCVCVRVCLFECMYVCVFVCVYVYVRLYVCVIV
jgi:hypothetical protein